MSFGEIISSSNEKLGQVLILLKRQESKKFPERPNGIFFQVNPEGRNTYMTGELNAVMSKH